MHLLITGFASIAYLHGEAGLRELSFEFEFVVFFPDHPNLLFLMSLLLAVLNKTGLEKSVIKLSSFVMRLLSCFASSLPCFGLVCNV